MLGRNEKDYTMYIISVLLRDANNKKYDSSSITNGVITLNISSLKTFKSINAICDCILTFNRLALAMSHDDDFRLLRLRMYRNIMYIIKTELFD